MRTRLCRMNNDRKINEKRINRYDYILINYQQV